MIKKAHLFRHLAVFVLLAAAAVLAVPGAAQAAAGKTTKKAIKLKDGKNVRSYDITGDGEADRIKIKYISLEDSSTGEAYARVYLNGRKKKTIKMQNGGDIYLIAPTSKTVFLIAESCGTDCNSDYLYRWKSGKFRSAYKNSLGEDELDHTRPHKVSKSGFSMLAAVGKHQNFVDIDCVAPVFVVNYKIKDGKVSLKSRYAKIYGTAPTAKAQYAWKMSSNPKTDDGKGPSLIGGGTVKILQMYLSGSSKPSFQLESETGETGWITYDMYAYNEKPMLH